MTMITRSRRSSTPYPQLYGSPSSPHTFSYSPSTEKQESLVKSLPNLATPAPPPQHYSGGGGYTPPQRPYTPAQHFRDDFTDNWLP